MRVSNYCVAGVFCLCFHTAIARRPPFSRVGGVDRAVAIRLGTLWAFVDGLFASLAVNGVVPAHHVLNGGTALVAGYWFGARLAGMVRIGT